MSATVLTVVNLPDRALAFRNAVLVSENTMMALSPFSEPPGYQEFDYFSIDGKLAYVEACPAVLDGTIALKGPDRLLYNLSIGQMAHIVHATWFGACASVSLKVEAFGGKPVCLELARVIKRVKEALYNRVMVVESKFTIDISGVILIFTVQMANAVRDSDQPHYKDCIMVDETCVLLDTRDSPLLKFDGGRIIKDVNFADLGIGGLDAQFKEVFCRILMSRMYPPDIAAQLGLKHVKGMIMYGPPGCGKTLIARQIGQMLNCASVKVVNGPELLNRFVGASEENVRSLFDKARAEPKGLHLVIFDEIDSLCKRRGGETVGNTDQVVNQLLPMLDGVEALNNILIIGLTNRFEALDPALLRAGRLEVHVEIGLPNLEARKQILQIHTRRLREMGWIDELKVDLDLVAERAEGQSGADIEAMVTKALQKAVARKLGVENATIDELFKLSFDSLRDGVHISTEDLLPPPRKE